MRHGEVNWNLEKIVFTAVGADVDALQIRVANHKQRKPGLLKEQGFLCFDYCL